MNLKIINLLIFSLFFVIACDHPINKDFIGFWKQADKNNYLFIKDNGGQPIVETYFTSALDTILVKTDFPAKTDKNTISINTLDGKVQGVLTDSKKAILIDGKHKYIKIDDAVALIEIKKVMDAQKIQEQLCVQLQQEVQTKRLELIHKPEDACSDDWINYLKDFHSRVPDRCSVERAEEGFPCL